MKKTFIFLKLITAASGIFVWLFLISEMTKTEEKITTIKKTEIIKGTSFENFRLQKLRLDFLEKEVLGMKKTNSKKVGNKQVKEREIQRLKDKPIFRDEDLLLKYKNLEKEMSKLNEKIKPLRLTFIFLSIILICLLSVYVKK